MMWFTWLAANISMWMNDVAAAWLMTSLTDKPILVALVQTASTLPVFLLGLPSGALADILDRKRFFLLTQVWVAVVALLLCTSSFRAGSAPGLMRTRGARSGWVRVEGVDGLKGWISKRCSGAGRPAACVAGITAQQFNHRLRLPVAR